MSSSSVLGSLASCAQLNRCAGLRVTLIEAGSVGGEQAASYGNAGWLSPQSVIPPAEPGTWKKVPGYLMDPLGPLAISPSYLPGILPWLWRYVLSASTPARLERIASALRPLVRDAAKLHQRIAAEAGLLHLVKPDSGLMHVYRSRQQFESDALGWKIRRQLGIDWHELSEQELRIQQPFLTKDYKFGVVVPDAGHCINPGDYVSGLVEYARACGANFVHGKAIGFRFNGNRLAAVRIEGREVSCDATVIAAGAYSSELAKAVGTKVLLETERGYHVGVEGVGIGPTIPIMVCDRKLNVTMMNQGLRISGQVELAGLKAAPNWCRADVLKKLLYNLFPDLPVNLPQERFQHWMGHRPSSPDGKPYIGRSNASPDVLLAFGHGHIGLGSSTRTGRVVAQLLMESETEIPLEPFSPQRFERSQ